MNGSARYRPIKNAVVCVRSIMSGNDILKFSEVSDCLISFFGERYISIKKNRMRLFLIFPKKKRDFVKNYPVDVFYMGNQY